MRVGAGMLESRRSQVQLQASAHVVVLLRLALLVLPCPACPAWLAWPHPAAPHPLRDQLHPNTPPPAGRWIPGRW